MCIVLWGFLRVSSTKCWVSQGFPRGFPGVSVVSSTVAKVVPPGGPVFGPFILSDVLKFCRLLCAQNTFCISSNLSNCCYLIQVSSPHPLLYSCKLPKGECALFYGGFLGFPLQSVGFPRVFPGVSQGFPWFPPQLQAFLKPNPKKEQSF